MDMWEKLTAIRDFAEEKINETGNAYMDEWHDFMDVDVHISILDDVSDKFTYDQNDYEVWVYPTHINELGHLTTDTSFGVQIML